MWMKAIQFQRIGEQTGMDYKKQYTPKPNQTTTDTKNIISYTTKDNEKKKIN